MYVGDSRQQQRKTSNKNKEIAQAVTWLRSSSPLRPSSPSPSINRPRNYANPASWRTRFATLPLVFLYLSFPQAFSTFAHYVVHGRRTRRLLLRGQVHKDCRGHGESLYREGGVLWELGALRRCSRQENVVGGVDG
jgi:hypothetical protein